MSLMSGFLKKNNDLSINSRGMAGRVNIYDQVSNRGTDEEFLDRPRNFIITKRMNPIKFKDLNTSEYEIVDSEQKATVFDSMTDLMKVLNKLCLTGDSGIWYREVVVTGVKEEHLYIFRLNSKVPKYVAYSDLEGSLYLTENINQAYKTADLSTILSFGLEKIPKATLNSLQIVDLLANMSDVLNKYIFNSINSSRAVRMLIEWETLNDAEAFKEFSDILEFRIRTSNVSDIFKREVLKLIGARKYLVDESNDDNKAFTKNALINLFSKMIELDGKLADLLYIEWFIRTKLMTNTEVEWLIHTKWFSNTVEYMKKKINI